jgi:hypothetical protein
VVGSVEAAQNSQAWKFEGEKCNVCAGGDAGGCVQQQLLLPAATGCYWSAPLLRPAEGEVAWVARHRGWRTV